MSDREAFPKGNHFFSRPDPEQILRFPILVVGGSTAAYAATLGALEAGAKVCLVQPSEIVGGQFTAQGLPASDDGKLVATVAGKDCVAGETFAFSRSYRQFRQRQRELQPINGKVVPNPGGSWVSHLSVTPVVAKKALEEAISNYLAQKQLVIIPGAELREVLFDFNQVRGVVFEDVQNNYRFTVHAKITIEATDLGDLLEVGKIESRIGQESRHDTGEAILPEVAYPLCQQAITFCAVVEKTPPGEGTAIAAPLGYNEKAWLQSEDFISTFWIHKPEQKPAWQKHDFWDELGIFTYRRLLRTKANQRVNDGDITVINWGTSPRPEQKGVSLCCGNDYRFGVLVGVSREQRKQNLQRARDRTLAYLYYLQTNGIDCLKPRGDLTWTDDGVALEPYIREARRGVALTTIRHEDVAQKFFGSAVRARCFRDSVGIGQYHYLDFHPNYAPGHVDLGDGKISLPFTIPLGALIPINTEGLILSAKSIGTTHITNSAYRMHPVEWAIGEAGGHLAAFCLQEGVSPRQVATKPQLTRQLQRRLASWGIPLFWFDDVGHDDPDFAAIQTLAASGILEPQARENLHFQPEGAVSRGAVCQTLVSLLDGQISDPIVPTFRDVAPEHEAFTSIENLHKQGIIIGVGDGRFAPNRPCQQEHLAIMIDKLGFEVDEVFVGVPRDKQLKRRELARILDRVSAIVSE